MAPCLFGDHCRFVCWHSDRYHNKRGSRRTCQYIHPEESRENYMERTGLDKIKIKPVAKVTDIVPVQVILKSGVMPSKRAWENPNKTVSPAKTMGEKMVIGSPRPFRGKTRQELEDIRRRQLANADYIKVLNKKNPCTSDDEESEEVPSDDEESELLEPSTEHATYTIPKAIALDTLKTALEAGHTKITLTIV